MPKIIVYVRDTGSRQGWYLEYCTVAAAPTTRGMKRAEMLKHLGGATEENKTRTARAYANGSSYANDRETAEQAMRHNTAGPHGVCLSLAGVVRYYCRTWEPSPAIDAGLRALAEWLKSAENDDNGARGIVERVTLDHGAVVDLYRNDGTPGRTSFAIHDANTPETVAEQCRAALKMLYRDG